MAVQAVPAVVYIGGSAVIAAFAYATNPELREATGSLANHLGNNFNNNVSAINEMIFGEDETQAPAVPRAATETATGEQTCPSSPYWHYTDQASMLSILSSRTFIARTLNYFTNRHVGPRTVFLCSLRRTTSSATWYISTSRSWPVAEFK